MTPSSLETQIIVLKIIIFIDLKSDQRIEQDNVWITNHVNYYPGKKKLNEFFTSVLSRAIPGF
jgi:hypothetical protein